MKNTQLILPITFLLFMTIHTKNYAQSECALYSKILDSVYKRTLFIRYSVNMPEKIDPLNPPKELDDTTTVLGESPYYIVVDEDFMAIFDLDLKNVIGAIKKEHGFKKLHFVQSNNSNLNDCDFSNSSFCFQKYKKGRDSIDFRKKALCNFKGKQIGLEKKLFRFSKFLKSSDGNFLITRLYVKEFLNPWVKNYWDVVLHKTKNGWVIERLETSSAGC